MNSVFVAAIAAIWSSAFPAQVAPPPRVSAPFDVAAIMARVDARVALMRPAPGRDAPPLRSGWHFPKRPQDLGDLTVPLRVVSGDEVSADPAGGFRVRNPSSGRAAVYHEAVWTDGVGLVAEVPVQLVGDAMVATVPAAVLDASTYPAALEPIVEPIGIEDPGDGPTVAFDGSNYLIAWSGPNGILAVRVSPQGVVLDPDGIEVTTSARRAIAVGAASNGSQFLLAWGEWREAIVYEWWSEDHWHYLVGNVIHHYAARVGSDGAVLDPDGFLVADTDKCGGGPISGALDCQRLQHLTRDVVATDGADYLVAWDEMTNEPVVTYEVLGTRVTADGAVLDVPAMAISKQISPAFSNVNPAVASDGTAYLVTWSRSDSASGEWSVVGARVTAGGSVLDSDGILISPAGEWQCHVEFVGISAVVWDGTDYLVAWGDRRSSPALLAGIYGARVSSGGLVRDPGGVPLASGVSAAGCRDSSLAAAYDGGYWLVLWTGASTLLAGRYGTDGSAVDGSPWPIPFGSGTAGPYPATLRAATDHRGTSLVVDPTGARFVTTWIPDTQPPALQVPSGIWQAASSIDGTVVEFSTSATDAIHGPVATSCSPDSGTLFAPGVTTVTCTATDPEGNVGTASFTVTVTFDWSGVLPPLNPGGGSVFKLGRVVPVKFALTGASAGIANLSAGLFVAKVSDGVVGTEESAGSTSAADSGNAFRYDAASGQYVFNLATTTLSAGTWRLRIDLADRVEHAILLSLRP